MNNVSIQRFIGLDVHKHYLIALGVDEQLHVVLPAQRVELSRLEGWMKKTLSQQDAVVLEMTTNTWQLYDDLSEHAGSVIVVHPPHVALITRSQVMNDKIAASILARLLAKGLLVGIWVPPQEVRELRALIAQRSKMSRLSTQAKNRLQAILQQHHWAPPEGDLFSIDRSDWWLALPLSKLEKINLQSDLDTLRFAETQLSRLNSILNEIATSDERVTRLAHLPGVGVVIGVTILAAIGDISRFADPRHLVGYAGLGATIHDSGMTTRTGKITKAGRRDLRAALVEAAQLAANFHPHWRAELARLEPRLGRNKAIVAIARKLLITVWYVLAQQATDRFADPQIVARKLMRYAYQIRKGKQPAEYSVPLFVRQQLDALRIGADLSAVSWGSRSIPLPPSTLGKFHENQRSDVPNTE